MKLSNPICNAELNRALIEFENLFVQHKNQWPSDWVPSRLDSFGPTLNVERFVDVWPFAQRSRAGFNHFRGLLSNILICQHGLSRWAAFSSQFHPSTWKGGWGNLTNGNWAQEEEEEEEEQQQQQQEEEEEEEEERGRMERKEEVWRCQYMEPKGKSIKKEMKNTRQRSDKKRRKGRSDCVKSKMVPSSRLVALGCYLYNIFRASHRKTISNRGGFSLRDRWLHFPLVQFPSTYFDWSIEYRLMMSRNTVEISFPP